MTQPDTIAVIADIHGNADALRAVLDDIRAAGITTIWNLGDHLSGPLAAAETLDLIRSTPMLCIRGNHDRWLMEQSPEEMGPSDRAAWDQLDAAGKDWLADLPATATPRDGVFLCHATPEDDCTYWMQDVAADGSVGPRPVEGIARLAATRAERLVLCGHTHLAGNVTLPDGRRVVNPGSVGLPAYDDDHPVYHVMEVGSPEARYAWATPAQDGWRITSRQVPYDPTRMIAMAREQGRDDWAAALATGRLPA